MVTNSDGYSIRQEINNNQIIISLPQTIQTLNMLKLQQLNTLLNLKKNSIMNIMGSYHLIIKQEKHKWI